MSLSLEKIEAEALELPASERSRLVHRLIASLDRQGGEEAENDMDQVARAWEEEIQRRLREYRSGTVRPIPASEVFSRARRRLG